MYLYGSQNIKIKQSAILIIITIVLGYAVTKLLCVFAGTGDTAINDRNLEKVKFNKDVIRVYFNGCQDAAIGGRYVVGSLSPNLDIVAQKTRECFDKQGELSIAELKKKFGSSIIIEPDSVEGLVEVDEIYLTGFSRGAVTTFSVARHLDDLGKPIQLFALGPVPGESLAYAKKSNSEYNKNHDLSNCKNLTHAVVVVTQCRRNVNYFHDAYFKQMAPYFNDACDSHVYSVPQKNHLSSFGAALNQQIDFLVSTECCSKKAPLRYEENKDPKFFFPKFMTQINHPGNAQETELLPRYRQRLILVLEDKGFKEVENWNVKTAQAMIALAQSSTSSDSDQVKLQNIVLNDKTNRGKLVREFIVEFENMNQHVLSKSKPAVKSSAAMNTIRQSFYTELIKLASAPSTGACDTQIAKTMHDVIINLKTAFLPEVYQNLKSTCVQFLDHMIPAALSDTYLSKLDEGEPLVPNQCNSAGTSLGKVCSVSMKERLDAMKRSDADPIEANYQNNYR